MSRDLVNDMVNAMEKMEETSFMDFPDEILIQFFEYLDIPSRLKLRRVNKRLNRLYGCVKNKLDKIELTINKDELSVEPSFLLSSLQSNYLWRSYKKFNVMARGTHVREIVITINEWEGNFSVVGNWNWRVLHFLLEALSYFQTDAMIVKSSPNNDFKHLHVYFHSLPALAKNLRSMKIECRVDTFNVHDIRKMMLKADCKLESFEVMVGDATRRSLEYWNANQVDGKFQTTFQNGPRPGWHHISFKRGIPDAD